MTPEAKKEYQRVWRAKKRAEKKAKAAATLAKQQANAAKARAAKAAKNGKHPTMIPLGWEVRVRPLGVVEFLVNGNVVYTTKQGE